MVEKPYYPQHSVRLVFTDVSMPGSMDGFALAHYVRGRWPPVKIIVTSGYTKLGESASRPGRCSLKSRTTQNIAHKMNELIVA